MLRFKFYNLAIAEHDSNLLQNYYFFFNTQNIIAKSHVPVSKP